MQLIIFSLTSLARPEVSYYWRTPTILSMWSMIIGFKMALVNLVDSTLSAENLFCKALMSTVFLHGPSYFFSFLSSFPSISIWASTLLSHSLVCWTSVSSQALSQWQNLETTSQGDWGLKSRWEIIDDSTDGIMKIWKRNYLGKKIWPLI